MKKNKNSDSTVSEPRIVTAPVEASEEGSGIPPALLPGGEQYLYFTERDIDRILENLDGLRDRVFPRLHGDEAGEPRNSQHFPSVCLIGLGRCGSNIALDVASLVYNARKFYLNEFSNVSKDKAEQRPTSWIRNNLRLSGGRGAKPVFLIEPLVMLGDLDKDIEGRIRFSRKAESNGFLSDYSKMKIMDLSEVHAGGAGNAPILGQYLAKIILNKDTQRFSNADWKFIHSYLIDSCGIKANQSRLYFYIFSAGGGTGSGMASEFGLAQQFSYMSKTFETKENEEEDNHSFVFEPIFTSGMCILPSISDQRVEMSEALHINAGRLLCKYLAEEWDFSYNFDSEETGEESVMRRIRPWNAMMLISNDIMRYAEESDGGNVQNIDVNAMERHANQYISQQIFNILTAQAVTTDYDQNYFRRAGIDIGETIRLDANDLFMSLAGPVAVAYAESVVAEQTPVTPTEKFKVFDKEPPKLNIDDLFFRSIDLPHFNKATQAIEGISLLPIEAKRYREALDNYKKSGFDASALSDMPLLQELLLGGVHRLAAQGLQAVLHGPQTVSRATSTTCSPIPRSSATPLVIGASANLSLTTLVVKSPCLSDDFLTLIVAFIKRCFAREPHRYDESLDNALLELIVAEEFDEARIDAMLNEHENPAKILDTNWFAIKPMYEKKYRELVNDRDKFVSINDIRLSRESVKKAIKYLREIYRHRIGKTRVISLNNYTPPV